MSGLFEAPKKIVSRRNRPAKPLLSLDIIVDTSLRLLAEKGPQALTLRKVAAELDTAAASLYVYVDNLEALNSIVLDKALAKVKIPKTGGDWRKNVSKMLWSFFEVLYQTPGLGTLAMNTTALGPNALRFYDRLLALLLAGGVSKTSAAWAVDMLPKHMAAIAAEQDARKDRTDPLGPITDAIQKAPEEEYPTVFALRDEIINPDGRKRVQWAIEVLINGVLATSNNT